MIPLCQAENIGLLPWSPLARGFLAANRAAATVRSQSDPFADHLYGLPSDYAVLDRLTELAAARGVPNAQLALAWMLAKPGITAPIVGATKMKHLDDALAALDLQLTPDEIAQLEAPYQPHPVLGH